MECPTCGNEVREGEAICTRCGTPLASSPPPPADGATPATRLANPATGGAQLNGTGSGATVIPAPLNQAVFTSTPVGSPPLRVAPAPTAAPITPITDTPAVTDSSATILSGPVRGVALNPFQQEEFENLMRQGHILLRRKNLDAAREACQKAMTIDAFSPQVHELMGQVLEAEGNEIGAFKEYRIACQVEPAPPEAEARMALLSLRISPEMLAQLQPKKREGPVDLPPAAQERLEQAARQGDPDARALLTISPSMPPPPMSKPRAGVPPFASLVAPGLGQAILGDYTKAGIMFLVWLVCAIYLSTFAFAHYSASSKNAVPLSDPFIWVALIVMGIDYLWSVADASAVNRDRT